MDQMDENQLLKLNKNQLVSQILDYRNKFSVYFDGMKSDIASMKENIAGLTKRNTELESSILINKNVNDKLIEKIVLLERRCTETQQYSRRECVEVSGLAPDADIVTLEKKVIEVFESINCTIDPDNIESCHYLKSKNQPNKVIVKLSRMKDVAKV